MLHKKPERERTALEIAREIDGFMQDAAGDAVDYLAGQLCRLPYNPTQKQVFEVFEFDGFKLTQKRMRQVWSNLQGTIHRDKWDMRGWLADEWYSSPWSWTDYAGDRLCDETYKQGDALRDAVVDHLAEMNRHMAPWVWRYLKGDDSALPKERKRKKDEGSVVLVRDEDFR